LPHLRTASAMSARRRPNVAMRPGSQADDREEIWKPMLDTMSSGKRLPEKSLLVLGRSSQMRRHAPFYSLTTHSSTGGTPETQREFLESVSTDNPHRPPDRSRRPPIANQFALGYTYQDVLDSDHEGAKLPLRHPRPC